MSIDLTMRSVFLSLKREINSDGNNLQHYSVSFLVTLTHFIFYSSFTRARIMNKIIIIIILVVEANSSFNRQSCPKLQTATSEICKLTFKE